MVVAGAGHFQRVEDALLQERLVRLAGGGLDDLAQGDKAGMAIGVLRTGPKLQRPFRHGGQDLVRCRLNVPVSGMPELLVSRLSIVTAFQPSGQGVRYLHSASCTLSLPCSCRMSTPSAVKSWVNSPRRILVCGVLGICLARSARP